MSFLYGLSSINNACEIELVVVGKIMAEDLNFSSMKNNATILEKNTDKKTIIINLILYLKQKDIRLFILKIELSLVIVFIYLL
tara:strand:- start:776 stop:1024 length:249 start_codon:yes stop_codon:yes gene_type:complete